VYSQEGEDMLLSKIFIHQSKGFYVDCGAHHPFRFSNTNVLYGRGWFGINIEPNPESADLFARYRSRDIYVPKGISKRAAFLDYHEYSHPALNTFDVELVNARTDKPQNVRRIETVSLESILRDNLPAGRTIDLLNVDVEGMDLEVLESNNWELYRPRYIMIELPVATVHEALNSDATNFLSERGYVLISKLWKSALFKREL
jgi:FkbM family methyltransferase